MERHTDRIGLRALVIIWALVVLCGPAVARASEAPADDGEAPAVVCVSETDCDGDGLLDDEEGDRDGDGEFGPDETDPNLADSDGDGVDDGEERRLGTRGNVCDTDADGLSDGVELRRIQPDDVNGCHGLQPAGTNFKKPTILDPLNPDADGDGLADGEEDGNGNGWLDANETDPTIEDTDGDGLADGLEAQGDFDGDGLPDYDFRLIKGGQKCSPPESIADVDCDGVPNARDGDSDNDGCTDALEGGWVDADANGIPDVFDNQTKVCPDEVASGGGGTPAVSADDGDDGASDGSSMFAIDPDDGGACGLVQPGDGEGVSPARGIPGLLLLLLAFGLIALSKPRRQP